MSQWYPPASSFFELTDFSDILLANILVLPHGITEAGKQRIKICLIYLNLRKKQPVS
jgi:hypothetical protein